MKNDTTTTTLSFRLGQTEGTGVWTTIVYTHGENAPMLAQIDLSTSVPTASPKSTIVYYYYNTPSTLYDVYKD